MSDLENWEGDARRRARTYGRASDNGQVYQSGANQYVTHIHIAAEARGRAAHEARERADVVVQALARAVGEWAARCQELEEQVERAKAEGRAEAQAEFAERLRDAELRVMQAQRVMREAEEERARAEAMLAQAQQELAQQRRAAERDRHDTAPHDPAGLSRDRQETEQFSELLEQAEAELGAVREELRQLVDEVGRRDGGWAAPHVIKGDWVQQSGTVEESAPAASIASSPPADVAPAAPEPKTAAEPRPERMPVPGPPRRFLIGVAWVLCALPPWIPMLAVTVVRAAFASDASLWGVVPFTFVVILVSSVGFLLALGFVAVVTMEWLSRDSETNAVVPAFLLSVVASLILFVAAFFTPLGWPGPTGAWGRGIASFVGLG